MCHLLLEKCTTSSRGTLFLIAFLPVLLVRKLLTEAVRGSHKFEDRGAMGEPIQQGGRHALIAAHDGGPLGKAQIGRNNDRDPLVEGGADLEQELGSGRGKRQKPQLVQDNQLVLADLRHDARELILLLRFDQIIHQAGHIVKADPVALPTSSQSQSCGNV